MLLSQEVTQGVEVLSVLGPVQGQDAAVLQQALTRAVDVEPRGVVIDLSDAGPLSAAAVDVLNWATARAAGWPRPSLQVCCATPGLEELLLPPVHEGRDAAMSHVDDRPEEQVRVSAVLDVGPQSPAQARRLAQECAREQGFDGDDLVLVVSELVTNALRHGTPPLHLEIVTCAHCATVVVTDCSSDRPVRRTADDQAEGGRGMLLVDLLAADSGVRPAPPGKAVWAELPR
ncbi:MAG: hypothetical protein JWO60_3213 [Frankiales bacterium]|nr:hypothetical protein [Frankiales bacterium]